MFPRSRIVLPLISAAAVIALILLVVLGGGSGGASSPQSTNTVSAGTGFDGAALPPEPQAPDFTLSDQYGRRVSLSSFSGQVTVLTFLYSTCGATCIVIAQQVRGALDELPRRAPVVIVSADPAADTPANVRRFLSEVSLSGRVEYLSGPLQTLQRIWREYHVTPASAGRAAFDKYASLLLIDPEGRERVLFQTEVLTPESLAHDIGKLAGEPTSP